MFITFEGIEGSGKSTIIRMLADYLRKSGIPIVLTREPGGSQLGKMFRSILLDARTKNLANDAELFLFLADRAQHVSEVINPALLEGKWVLCDRFSDSTLVYQGYGRGLGIGKKLVIAEEMSRNGLLPDLTFLLDLPVADGLARAEARNAENGTSQSEGRFDAEGISFHERVRDGFLQMAKNNPARFRIIDSQAEPGKVLAACVDALRTDGHLA